MSTIAEQAREEADRVEAEERALEEQEADPAEPGAEPEPDEHAAEVGEEPAEPAFEVDGKALERELKRHDKAMLATLGPEWASMEPCGHCGGMGAVPPGFVPVPEPVDDPDVIVCEACKGFGSRVTPSLKAQYAMRDCSVCIGTGYRELEAVNAENEHKRIMDEQAQRDAALAADYTNLAQAANGMAGYPPAPPSPVWNQALGRWEFPTDDAGIGGGVTAPLP